MDLTNKNKVDFGDAHLWACDAKFFVSLEIRKIPELFCCLKGMKMVIHPFLDFGVGGDINKWGVSVEFFPVVDVPPLTCQQIEEFLRVSIALGCRPAIEHDGWCALLDASGLILERWEADRR